MTGSELGKVYAAMLRMPKMDEVVKADLGLNRRQLLLLANVLEAGLNNVGEGVVQYFSEEDAGVLRSRIADILEKGGLTEVHGDLKGFAVK